MFTVEYYTIILPLCLEGRVSNSGRSVPLGCVAKTTYRLLTPKHAPFAIGYAFEGNPHDYLPDVVGTLTNGKLFITEAGMEDDKRQVRSPLHSSASMIAAFLADHEPLVSGPCRKHEQMPPGIWSACARQPGGLSARSSHRCLSPASARRKTM
jgi:hypothetical protein